MKIATVLLLVSVSALGQSSGGKQNDDAHFHGVQQRGEAHQGMGFSQTETTHHFFLTPTGGEIQVTANDRQDSASIEQIRNHFAHIAALFAKGDFNIPHFVHGQNPPGVKTMQKLSKEITYRNERLDDGARIVISTKSPQALAAIHDFLRFQITDHRTGDPLEPAVKQ